MDIRHLRYFVGIADSGSLMKASERLHVAQPALSVHLSTLEVQLGVTLMRRSSRGVELTEDGRELYERATTLLRYHRETVDAFKTRRSQASGTVSIGIPSSHSPLLAPALYRRIREELPDVSLYISDASTAALYEWLTDGRLDFSILFSVPEDAHLDSVPLRVDEFCLISKGDGKRYPATVAFEQIFDRPLVLSSRPSTWRKILDDVAERQGKRLESIMETESASVLKALVSSGQASTLLAASTVQAERRSGVFRVQRVINPEIRGVLSLVHLHSTALTPAMRGVRERIIEVVKEMDTPLDSAPTADAGTATPILRALPGRMRPSSR